MVKAKKARREKKGKKEKTAEEIAGDEPRRPGSEAKK